MPMCMKSIAVSANVSQNYTNSTLKFAFNIDKHGQQVAGNTAFTAFGRGGGRDFWRNKMREQRRLPRTR